MTLLIQPVLSAAISRKMTKLNKLILAAVLIVISLIATLIGFIALSSFEFSPGESAEAPSKWPRDSTIKIHGDRPEMLVFAHPFCNCMKATISELERLEVSRPANLPVPAVTFVVFRPDANSTWKRTDLELRASRLRNVRFVWDDGGAEAKRFGATTSGTVMLYGAGGKLLFHGGITGSRGHEGENFGLAKLRGLLEGETPRNTSASTSKVFGCALWNPLSARSAVTESSGAYEY